VSPTSTRGRPRPWRAIWDRTAPARERGPRTLRRVYLEINNSTNDTICGQNQCNDATVFRIPEEQQKYEYGSPEYEALQDISDHISEGLEERQAARDEAADRC
jgi:hypothetical protein